MSHPCTLCAWLLPRSQKTHLVEGKVMRDDVPGAGRCFGGAQRQIPNPLVQGSLTCHSLSCSRYFSTVLSTPSTEVPPPSLSSVGCRYCEGGQYAIPHSGRHQIQNKNICSSKTSSAPRLSAGWCVGLLPAVLPLPTHQGVPGRAPAAGARWTRSSGRR